MSIVRRISLVGALFLSMQTAQAGPEELLLKLEDFLSAAGDTRASLNGLDFYNTSRLAIPLGEVNVGFDIGAGAGSILLPLPSGQSPHLDFSNGSLVPGSANQFAKAGLQVLQSQLRDILGLRNIGAGDSPIDFFDTSGSSLQKKHWAEHILDFKITPGVVYGIKTGLLVKHYLKHRKDHGRTLFKYLADFAVLTIRLLRSWQRDSRAIGGIASAIDERAPMLGQVFRQLSQKLPKSVNSTSNELFIHERLDAFWKMVMNTDGILFGSDGSIQRGLGFAVSGFDCGSPEDAAVLSSFLNRKQINWDVLESDTFKGQSFLEMTGNLVDMFGWQIAKVTGEDHDDRRAEYLQVRAAFTKILETGSYANYGRYDIDQTNNETAHHILRSNQKFVSLTQAGGPLSSYKTLPRVVQADSSVYFCTNKMTGIDAARLLAVIVFQALWRYMDALRGQGPEGTALLKQVEKHQKNVSAAQHYFTMDESYFLHAHGPALFARPTTNVYSMAKVAYEHTDSRKYVQTVMEGVKEIHMKGVQRRAQINIDLLERLKKTIKTSIEIPQSVELPKAGAAA